MVKRKIDELGRVVIPRDYREKLSLSAQTPLSMELVGDRIIIKKLSASCALCGKTIAEDAPIALCPVCLEKAKKY